MRHETPRRSGEMAGVRGKRSTDIPSEMPIGGWNTRDSIDNLPPTDALLMDNWMPDLGSVKVRKGYIEHSDSSDITSGSELVLNPGFETAGPGPYPDVFADWDEDPGNGIIFQVTVGGGDYVHSGSHSCALSRATVSPGVPPKVQQTMAVVASETYKFDFWILNGGSPGQFPWYAYAVYDVSNAAYIIPETSVQTTKNLADGETWELNRVFFETPVGCVSVRLDIIGASQYLDPINGANLRLDDVSLLVAHDPTEVETLMVFDHEGGYKMIAADGGIVWDASTSSPTQLNDGYTNNRWSWTNFQDLLIMANGVDVVQQYDGTTLQNINPLLTGPTAPVGCHAFKHRMYYWDADSQDVWYTALRAPGGVCTKFALSEIGRRGGDLIAMFTWTRDGGSGADDFAVFMMSSGETLIYQGSSPSSIADWALVGIYDIGEPLGPRCGAKFGGDLLVATTLDFLPFSQAMQGEESIARRSKISGALREVVGNKDYFGWDVNVFPEDKILIVNVPIVEGETYYQYVLNLVTGAWCRFKDIKSHCWLAWDGKMFFGGDDGVVYEAFNGYNDLGASIKSDLQTSWLTFGTIENKQFDSIRQTFRSDVSVAYTAAFATDFKSFNNINYPVATPAVGTPWGPPVGGITPWGSPWGAVLTVEQVWKIISGYGRYISMLTKSATLSPAEILSNIWHVKSGTRM